MSFSSLLLSPILTTSPNCLSHIDFFFNFYCLIHVRHFKKQREQCGKISKKHFGLCLTPNRAVHLLACTPVHTHEYGTHKKRQRNLVPHIQFQGRVPTLQGLKTDAWVPLCVQLLPLAQQTACAAPALGTGPSSKEIVTSSPHFSRPGWNLSVPARK